MKEQAMLGAGCFWGVEEAFFKTPGILETKVGYSGGQTINPTYKEVCTDTTGHAEVVHIEFDNEKITYEQVLELFWSVHDPTTLDRQGPDVGAQYRSVIYYYDEQQLKSAKQSIEKLESENRFQRPIVTQLSPAGIFYPAEEYHQKYFLKNGSCRI